MAVGEPLSADRPFPGLRPFDEQDCDYFFGRDEQSYALYNLLELSHFVTVVGSSGSGKSSLVRAGLLPLLNQDAKEAEEARKNTKSPVGRDWNWIQFRPGDAPLSRLAEQLASKSKLKDPIEQAALRERLDATLRRTSSGLCEALSSIEALADCSLLIVVDQFEELFRFGLTGSARARLQEERDQFVQLLLEATRGSDLDINAMITMRSDFIGDCAQFSGLPEAVCECQFLVPSLTRLQLEEVICKPFKPDRANAFIDSALVEQLINDAAGEPDQLPVLQHCLSRLWEVAGPSTSTPPHRRLYREHYVEAGGIAEALSRHADAILAGLTDHQIAVEQTFRALSEVDKEGRATRRALTFADLCAETGVAETELRLVVDRFRADDCSFLVPLISAQPELRGETTVDIGHESLLRRWHKIGAEAPETLQEDTQAGWLEAEANDARDYRMMLRLAGTDPDATLPLNRVDRLVAHWKERPRTSAWAKRYGGHIERIEQLFENTRRSQRRRWWSRVSITAVIATLATSLLTWGYIDYRLEKNYAESTAKLIGETRQERLYLLNEMTELTQKISTDLRFIPGTNHSILKMLDSNRNFSSNFSKVLSIHYPNGLDDREKRIENILAYRADFLIADYWINFGNIREAIKLLKETEEKLDYVPKVDGHEAEFVQLLRADIRLHRANAEMVYGAPDAAKHDFADAEEIYRKLQEPSVQSAVTTGVSSSGDEAQAELGYPEKAKRRLAELYQSRIFLSLQYRRDAAAAQHDLDAFNQLIEEQQKAHPKPPSDHDEPSDYWRSQTLRLQRLRAELWIAQRNFGDAISSLNKLLEDIGGSQDVSAEVYQAYLNYELGLAQMREGTDIGGAIGNLKKAESEFSRLSISDRDNMWWRLVRTWINSALGQAYVAQHDEVNAERAYKTARDLNAEFVKSDPNNRQAQEDLENDESAMTALHRTE